MSLRISHTTLWFLFFSNILFADVTVTPGQISETLYSGSSVTETITITNNNDSDLDWEISFSNLRTSSQGFVLPEGFRNESYTMDPIATSTGDGNAFDANNFYTNSAIHQTRDESFNVFVYNNSNLSNIINEHPDLSSNYGSYTASTLEDVDVLFNIRSGNLIPEETLEWIYNGGTWIGEWSSNDYPINSWGVIGGSVGSGGCCTAGSVNIIDSDHWLAQNIDWDNVPVGSGSTQFQRFITIDDPDANVIITTTVTAYGEYPLFVEKQYGDGTILLFNWDYQDSPQSYPGVVEMIKQVAYYGAAIAGGVNWLSFSENSGTLSSGSSQNIDVLIDATSLEAGTYLTEFFILSNDVDQSAIEIPVNLTVQTPTPDISISPESIEEILFVDESLTSDIIIQNVGVADLNWNLNLLNYGRDGSSYTFTNCDKEGNQGPSQQDCDSEYQGTTLEGFVTVDGGIQQWIVPASGTYTIDLHGAKGGNGSYGGSYVGGLGANMQGKFDLEEGQILNILVGQKGTSTYEGGGGGGSFVVKEDDTPLIVAGGGGGAGGYGDGVNGVTETSGTDGAAGGAGGVNGNGGSVINGNAGSGAGFYTDGVSNVSGAGKSYLNGGIGGYYSNWAAGGFGGGGNGWGNGGNGGGAGGYSGGGTSSLSYIGGGGGGSFNSGLDQNNIAGVNSDHGVVTITLDAPAISWATLSDNAGVTPAGESDTVTLALNANGLEIGEYSAGISLSSNDPDESDIDIPISITVINNVVIADIDDASIEEDSSLELLLINDYGSYDYIYTATADTSAIVASMVEDTLKLIPQIDWTGSANISVILSIENMVPDTTDFNLTVTAVNDPPIAYNASYSVSEDDTLNTVLVANDGDSLSGQFDAQELEFIILESFDNGMLSLGSLSGEMNYIPIPNYFGMDTLVYAVVDNGVTNGVATPLSDTAAVIVEVIPVNDAPVLVAMQNISMYEDESLSIPVLVSDIDNDELTLTVTTSEAENLNAEIINMVLHLTPVSNWHDTVEVIVVADDNQDIDIEQFELIVYPVNDAPNAYDDVFYINEDETLQATFLADDGDSLDNQYDVQELTFSVMNGFYHGSFEFNDETGDFAYVPELNFFGSDTLTYIVEDNGVTGDLINPLTDTATIVVHTLPVNDEPVLVELSDTVMYEDSSLVIPIEVSDVDNDYIDLEVYTNNEEYISSIIEEGYLHLNSYFNWNGVLEVTVTANDNEGRAIDVEVFQLNVLPVNDAPEFVGQMHALVGVGIDFEFALVGYDVDMDILSFDLDNSYNYPDSIQVLSDPYRLVGNFVDDGLFNLPILCSDGIETVVDTFRIDAQYFQPRIASITDVPNDQGRRVYLEFQRSFFDIPEETNQFYTIYRLDNMGSEMTWVGINTISATGTNSYVVEVSTLRDSTSIDDGLTEFRIGAFTNHGVFQSAISAGYSTDNLAPLVPNAFTASIVDQNVILTWNQSSDVDFDYFILDKSHSVAFNQFEAILLDDTSFVDSSNILNIPYYYRLSAQDFSGNRSDYTNVIEMIILQIDDNMLPDQFALHQNYPNPFNPTTTIRYDIAQESRVLIQVFDIQGRLVKTLVEKMDTPGKKSIHWNATNQIGDPVSAGMYLYIIQTDSFNDTKKMLLLK